MIATPATMMKVASSVRAVSGSPANAQPTNSATTGLTKA